MDISKHCCPGDGFGRLSLEHGGGFPTNQSIRSARQSGRLSDHQLQNWWTTEVAAAYRDFCTGMKTHMTVFYLCLVEFKCTWQKKEKHLWKQPHSTISPHRYLSFSLFCTLFCLIAKPCGWGDAAVFCWQESISAHRGPCCCLRGVQSGGKCQTFHPLLLCCALTGRGKGKGPWISLVMLSQCIKSQNKG